MADNIAENFMVNATSEEPYMKTAKEHYDKFHPQGFVVEQCKWTEDARELIADFKSGDGMLTRSEFLQALGQELGNSLVTSYDYAKVSVDIVRNMHDGVVKEYEDTGKVDLEGQHYRAFDEAVWRQDDALIDYDRVKDFALETVQEFPELSGREVDYSFGYNALPDCMPATSFVLYDDDQPKNLSDRDDYEVVPCAYESWSPVVQAASVLDQMSSEGWQVLDVNDKDRELLGRYIDNIETDMPEGAQGRLIRERLVGMDTDAKSTFDVDISSVKNDVVDEYSTDFE